MCMEVSFINKTFVKTRVKSHNRSQVFVSPTMKRLSQPVILVLIGHVIMIHDVSTAGVCPGKNEVAGCRDACPQTCENIEVISSNSETDICVPECRCKDGFYRNKIGECISEANCRRCTGPNEYYSDGGSKNEEVCRCEEGYTRDDNNICVPLPDCTEETCGENELPTSCFEAICERRNCTDLDKPVICVRMDPRFCTKGCLCKEGYLRDANNVCVPINQCPQNQCGDNEVYDICPELCPGEKCGVDPRVILCLPNPKPGDPRCKPGCRCKDNYFRTKKGACVPKDQCPKPVVCGPNEVHTDCVNGGCGIWHCSQTQEICNLKLDGACEEGCHCKDGFLRAENGSCIPADQCPPKCNGPHEYFSCGSACDNACATLSTQNQTNCPMKNKKCNPKCYCQEGYARDANKVCIPISKCPPPTCGINEVYDTCLSSCPPRICGVDERVRCMKPLEPGDPKCEAGCRCADGFFRNKSDICVTKNECNVCGINEIYDVCPSTCPSRTCAALAKPINYLCRVPLKPGDPNCMPGCRCADGYYKNAQDVCVPKNECPKLPGVVCGPDEVYSSCVNGGCGRWNCSQPGEICIKLAPDACKEGCRCKEGLLRADDGSCIPADQCPLNCFGQNEVRGCKKVCPLQNCENIGKILPCPLEPAVCTPDCRCKDGYYRNKINQCISKEDCLKCTGPHEYFSCGGACDNVCNTLATQNQTNCPIRNIVCNRKCYCEKGYARDHNKTCVAISKCPPPVCGSNEVYDVCPATCPSRSCNDVEKVVKCPAPLKPGDPKCKPGCRCADGYYKNKENVCVPKDKCPKPPGVVCGPDEEYSSCVNGGCGRWNCSQPGIICIDLVKGGCKEGCRCKKGLLRADNGSCIPADQCPLNCFGQNEVRGCKKTCPLQICENIGKKFYCPMQPAVCIPDCRCKDGYYRNKLKQCISEEDCLKCTGPHEYFSCGGACDNVCDTMATQNQTNCPLVNIMCNRKCYCEEGYARDRNNTCVPISKCPPPVCGSNEIYDVCPPTCPSRTCNDVGKAFKCPAPLKPGDPNCKPGCRCADGYYKNKQGVCVTKDKCPKPVTCGPDEDYSGCMYAGCGRWNCSQPGILCVDYFGDYSGCKEGCLCKKGLLRADNGKCIPADQCPLNCYGQNEVSDCESTCPQTCEIIGKKLSCPRQSAGCKQECRCKKGFYRNKINDCISEKDCLKCTGPNEYFSCGGACDNVCTDLNTQNQTNCPEVNIVCNPMCYCEKEYARDKNKICVPISKCPGRDDNTGNVTADLLDFEQGNVAFTEKFLYEAAIAKPGVSLILSPFSVRFPLALFAYYADGILLNQLLTVLNLDSKTKIPAILSESLDSLSSPQNVTFNLVEKVYGNINYKFTPSFQKDTKDIFKAEAESLDFCKPSDAARTINEWVELQTNKLIKNLVSPDALSCNTVLVLTNAIYFKGDWKDKFDPKNTKKQEFYVNKDKSVQVDMMSRTGSYKYAEIDDLDAQVIELPYKNEQFSFLVWLPKSKDGITDMLNKLKDASYSISKTMENLKFQTVQLSIPAFNTSTTTDLKDMLIKTIGGALFDPQTSSLNGIFEGSQRCYVSSATQKATIIFNEVGSEAAAANVNVVSPTAVILPRAQFNANHPFVYFILSKGTPMFCGTYFGDV